MLKIDYQHLKDSRQGVWIAVDLMMLGLLIINLTLIIIDALFATDLVASLVRDYTPGIYDEMQFFHANFLLIDLGFIAIFLTEFVVRWYFAVKEKIYERWYFFPFLHWYDLLGCIPLGSTRLLRFLRIFSIIYRLHKYGIIDFTNTRVFSFISFYYNVFLEELSDRVVVKVITGIQEDLQQDTQLGEKILARIVEPRLPGLATSWEQMITNLAASMREDQDNVLANKLRHSVGFALQTNADLKRIQTIPIVGSQLAEHMEDTVADIVVDAIANLLEDAQMPEDLAAWKSAIHRFDDHSNGSFLDFDHQLIGLVTDILEVAKEQVARQSWKGQLNAKDSVV